MANRTPAVAWPNRRLGVRPALAWPLLLLFPIAVAQTPPRVESFLPDGTIREVRQVAVRFSATMTAFGDPRTSDPFAIDCAVPGRGSWIDSRNWVFDFDTDLPGGIGCVFTLREGLTTRDGIPLGGPREFHFNTGGPAVRASLPAAEQWQRIDESQTFILATNAPATAASVQEHAYCKLADLAERIPVQVLAGDARDAVLAQRRQLGHSYWSILWADGLRTQLGVRDRSVEQAEQSLTVLSCARPLPPDTEVHLIWGAGIAAPGGIATTAAQTLAFRTRPAFRATLDCERAQADAGCLPLSAIRVRFTAPVPRAAALAARLHGPNGLVLEPRANDEASPLLEMLTFAPSHVDSGRLELHLPADLRDDAGRPLDNAARFPLAFTTDAFPPLAKFAAEFGILEASEGGVLPVTVRNLDGPDTPRFVPGRKLRVASDPAALARWFDGSRRDRFGQPVPSGAGVTAATPRRGQAVLRDGDAATSFALPVPTDGREAEVIGIPLGEPGFYVVELASPRLGAALNGESSVYYVHTLALVTNLAVHFKWGRERSLIWVTRLDSGMPVADAEVRLTNVCTGANLFSGRSDQQGVVTVGPNLLTEPDGYGYCGRNTRNPIYLASARVGEDIGFTLSTWNDGIEPYQFRLPTGRGDNELAIHTVLDRPLFRAGERVAMKHFVRRRVMAGFDTAARGETATVTIRHLGSDDSYRSTVDFDANGTALQHWQIPEGAKLGAYTISIRLGERDHAAGQFQVQQFRVPALRALVQGPAAPQVRPSTVTLDFQVNYLSGGGASGLPVTLRFSRRPNPVSFTAYASYNFTDRRIVPGREPIDYGFDFEADPATTLERVEARPLTLDRDGAARIELPIDPIEQPEQLIAELDYPDSNGEILTTVGRVALHPAALAVGIQADPRNDGTRQVQTRVVVLDLAGKPVAKQEISLQLYSRQRYGYRKRLLGGFYGYENFIETQPLDATCSGRTNAQGVFTCDLASPVSGELLARAATTDRAGHRVGATAGVWLAGDDDVWQGSSDTDRMDLLPERPEYGAGEVAKFQVKLPFREATALVTVEREGVIESFVTTLRGRDPVIRVPIKPEYAPNVYVSVLALRGRIADTASRKADTARGAGKADPGTIDGGLPTALIDLSKPAYRLGAAAIRVGWDPNRIDVKVMPDRSVYRIREQMQVRVKARRADGAALPAGAEVALAVVDEGLLELAPNRSWALLEEMMGRRGLEVWTATAQMQVVGKRHYGRKALPSGGGGGRNPARELFDTLLAWHGRVVLDARGEATVTAPLNDSLTGFRIVAIASAGAHLFGSGSAAVTTRQDLMLLSGLPSLVREGDAFDATVTVRNASKKALAVAITAAASGLAAPLAPQRIALEPGAARDVIWRVPVPAGIAAIDWDIQATTSNGTNDGAGDRLRTRQQVVPAVPVRVLQATIAPLDAALTVPIARPADALPGRGGIELSLLPKLTDGAQEGVLRYLRAYPYICLEQVLSKAVGLRDAELWRNWMNRLPSYFDGDGLLKYFPSAQLSGEDTLTSYVLAIADEAGWEIPEESRRRMLDALNAFVSGRLSRRSALPSNDLALRKLAAIAALARHAAARPDLLDALTIEPNLWPTSALLDWITILQRLPGINLRQQRLDEAVRILRARFVFRGTTLTLATERSDALWWLMVSTDANAARALSLLLRDPRSHDDLPRLLRGLLGRQVRGHWNTTVANAWGMLALEQFSTAFEAERVTGVTQASLAGQTHRTDWNSAAPVTAATFAWSDAPATVEVAHQGTGTPWALLRASAAVSLRQPLTSGYRITRTLSPVEQRVPDRWSRGDLLRVQIEIEAQSDMTWVVVDDPIPAGASILGSGLGGQSTLARRDEQQRGWSWPTFQERRADAYRAYYRFVPKGTWSVEYTVRLNNPGTFALPPTRVEAMYAPEVFGELPNDPLTVAAGR
ncbi:MAG: hypothetical protein IT494_07960 [Gammaproteobacteria bacterium]|nr:hypothetical protein [Gammaproteobacteria bacterium]